jgi:hypothetical protein
VRTLFVRGHGPTHGPDGRLLGQGIGTVDSLLPPTVVPRAPPGPRSHPRRAWGGFPSLVDPRHFRSRRLRRPRRSTTRVGPCGATSLLASSLLAGLFGSARTHPPTHAQQRRTFSDLCSHASPPPMGRHLQQQGGQVSWRASMLVSPPTTHHQPTYTNNVGMALCAAHTVKREPLAYVAQ